MIVPREGGVETRKGFTPPFLPLCVTLIPGNLHMYIWSRALIAAHEFTGSDNSAMCINPAVLCEYDRSNAVSEVQAIPSYLPRRDVSTEPSLQTGYQSVSSHHLLLCRVRAENWLSHKIIYNRKVLRFCCSVVTYFSLNRNHLQSTCFEYWYQYRTKFNV